VTKLQLSPLCTGHSARDAAPPMKPIFFMPLAILAREWTGDLESYRSLEKFDLEQFVLSKLAINLPLIEGIDGHV
jgi:hypothetical protein